MDVHRTTGSIVQRASAWTGCLLVCVLSSACSDDSSSEQERLVGEDAGAAMSGDGDGGSEQEPGSSPVDLAALEATGLSKYLGAAKPVQSEVVGDQTHHSFAEADGPVCLRGTPFSMATRATDSEDLVIYLQGGGACSNAICQATERATPMIPPIGILNADDTANPVAAWNAVYVPYCDGSLHIGDSEVPDQNRVHHGLRNLSASLDVAAATFEQPRRILLAGASAGGYGTIWASTLVRLVYPDAKLYVLNDAGIALFNPASPEGFRGVFGEWGATEFIPDGCEACNTTPHLTQWMSWYLEHDPTVKLAMFSSYEDSVIAGVFLMLDPALFKQLLLEETETVVETAPARAKRFLVSGSQHTVRDIHGTAVDGLSFGTWLARMLDDDPAWDNVVQ